MNPPPPKPSAIATFTSGLNVNLLSVCRNGYFCHLYSQFYIYFVRKKKKNQLVLNLLMDFCDQCQSTQRGSLGPASSQLMWLKGNCHWCCFPSLLGQRACGCCHGPDTRREGPLLSCSSPSWTVDRRERKLRSTLPTVKSTPTWANGGSNQGWKCCLLIS